MISGMMPTARRLPGDGSPRAGSHFAAAPSAHVTILGVDPGLQVTGYAILRGLPSLIDRSTLYEAGVIRIAQKQPLECRLLELDRALDRLIESHRPHLLACEQLYAHYKHPRTAILMGHARGVILAVAAKRNVPVQAVAATNVKKLLTGNGHATKPQMQRAVAATLRLPELPEPHDVADAIAIALCGMALNTAHEQVAIAEQAAASAAQRPRPAEGAR